MSGGKAEDNILNCPFCRRPIDAPREIKTVLGNTFAGGKCECSAVYVFDRSGHNLGEAYVDALVYACNDDWDMAWSLIPDKDYEVRERSFDSRRGRFSNLQRRPTATFLFVLVKKNISKVETDKTKSDSSGF
jgi:hypothetical protein